MIREMREAGYVVYGIILECLITRELKHVSQIIGMMEKVSHLVLKQAPKTELGKESLRKGIDTFTIVNGLTQ